MQIFGLFFGKIDAPWYCVLFIFLLSDCLKQISDRIDERTKSNKSTKGKHVDALDFNFACKPLRSWGKISNQSVIYLLRKYLKI